MNTHIKSFNIYDFRGIKNLKLNDLKGINIITGDNNSGKTSVLEVINYLSGVDSLSNLAYSTTRGVNDYNQANTRFLPYERIQYLFPIDQKSPVIHYCFEMNKKIDVKIEKKKAYDILPQSEIRKLQGYTFDKIKEQITKYDDSFIENTEEIEISYLKFLLDDKLLKEEKITQYSRIKRAESKFYINTVYVTPFKHTTNEVYLTEVLNNPKYYQEMIEVLKEFDDSIMSINADTHNLTNKKRYMILSKNHNQAIPLELYGDGMKKAILLMSAVITAQNGILLLDEFETAIHTSAMIKVFSWILRACKKLNVQIFLTSHSEEAINKLLICCPELQNDIQLYTLYKRENQTKVRTLTCKEAIELHDDLGCYIPNNGYLKKWADQGVLLLNTVLTVRAHQANSHQGHGWEQFTDAVIQAVNAQDRPIVYMLWGAPARRKKAMLTNPKHLILEAPHPSPLSAYRGFFGCKHFSKANEFLKASGLEPIDWQIENI